MSRHPVLRFTSTSTSARCLKTVPRESWKAAALSAWVLPSSVSLKSAFGNEHRLFFNLDCLLITAGYDERYTVGRRQHHRGQGSGWDQAWIQSRNRPDAWGGYSDGCRNRGSIWVRMIVSLSVILQTLLKHRRTDEQTHKHEECDVTFLPSLLSSSDLALVHGKPLVPSV